MEALVRVWLCSALLVAACAPAKQPYRSAGIRLPPASLLAIATNVRSVGGIVFVGEPTGGSMPTASQIGSTADPDLFVSQPQIVGTVRVVDDLGAPIGETVEIVAPSADTELVDAEGRPSETYYLETEERMGWEAYALPTSGRWVFFATPTDGGAFLTNWRAPVDGDAVDASHTAMGGQTSLEALRLP